MNPITTYFLLVALAITMALTGVVIGHRRGAARWPIIILAVFGVCAVWQEVALRTFASREPEGMQALLLRPVPNAGGDHEFTPNGNHYAKYAFIVPGISALAVALVVAVLSVAARRSGVRNTLSVTLAVLGGALGLALFSVARFLSASEIFI